MEIIGDNRLVDILTNLFPNVKVINDYSYLYAIKYNYDEKKTELDDVEEEGLNILLNRDYIIEDLLSFLKTNSDEQLDGKNKRKKSNKKSKKMKRKSKSIKKNKSKRKSKSIKKNKNKHLK